MRLWLRAGLVLLLLSLSTVAAFLLWPTDRRSDALSTTLRPISRAKPRPEPKTLVDQVFPGRPTKVLGQRDPHFDGISALPFHFDSLRPSPKHFRERSAKERGVNPCAMPDPGFGQFSSWEHGTGLGKLMKPKQSHLQVDGRFDLVAQFHGYELARMEVVRSGVPVVFLGLHATRGRYSSLAGPAGLSLLIDVTERYLSKQLDGVRAHAEHTALTAWSGGYHGVLTVLKQSQDTERIDAVVLLDGLHASRDPELSVHQLRPFVEFAKRAARGEAFMFVSYSSIPTDDYASTTETARMLIQSLGGYPLAAQRTDTGGLQLKELFSKGNFHARGYRGGGKLDHCAHLLLLKDALQALYRHWYPG